LQHRQVKNLSSFPQILRGLIHNFVDNLLYFFFSSLRA
jgi:hypothetical protein